MKEIRAVTLHDEHSGRYVGVVTSDRIEIVGNNEIRCFFRDCLVAILYGKYNKDLNRIYTVTYLESTNAE